MNQCFQSSWSKLNTAAMLYDVFSVTKTHYVPVMACDNLCVFTTNILNFLCINVQDKFNRYFAPLNSKSALFSLLKC